MRKEFSSWNGIVLAATVLVAVSLAHDNVRATDDEKYSGLIAATDRLVKTVGQGKLYAQMMQAQEAIKPFVEAQRARRDGIALTTQQMRGLRDNAPVLLALLNEVQAQWEAAGLISYMDENLMSDLDRIEGQPLPDHDLSWLKGAGFDENQMEMGFGWPHIGLRAHRAQRDSLKGSSLRSSVFGATRS